MKASDSYFLRCQQWLQSTPDITVATLEQTLAKFTRQLDNLTEEEWSLADDLEATMFLLEQALLQRQHPDSHVSPPSPDNDYQLDASPLVDHDAVVSNTLSPEEKQQRLKALLESEQLRLGARSIQPRLNTPRNPEDS